MDHMTADQREYARAIEEAFESERQLSEARASGSPLNITRKAESLGSEFVGEFEESVIARQETEERWLTDLRQYKGQYEPEELAAMQDRSQAFLRKTRVKVQTITARMMDLLFPANHERNYGIEATPEPSIPPERRAEIVEAIRKLVGQEPTKDQVRAAIREHVEKAADRMSSRIDDQLTEAKYRSAVSRVLFSGNLYGTGILKGPLVERKTRMRHLHEGGRWASRSEQYYIPFMESTPVWNWYPDMSATEIGQCRYAYQRHRMTRSALLALASKKSFRGDLLREHIMSMPSGYYKPRGYEEELRSLGGRQSTYADRSGQYELLERWGWIDGEKLIGAGMDLRTERSAETFFGNVWLLATGEIIKAVLSPVDAAEWPWHLYYVDKDETSIFAEGFSAIMRDDQKMMNAGIRALLDNAAVTAGPILEMYLPALQKGEELRGVYPFRKFLRTGGDMQYPAVRSIDLNAHIPELANIIKLFDENADDVTTIPKFSYGDNPTSGAAATMGGLSMLLTQVNIALKNLVTNFDDGITLPFLTSLYGWNMRWSRDEDIKGDFNVKATGASSLVAREVRATMMLQFAAGLQPEERPFVKWHEFLEQRAKFSEFSGIVMTKEEADDMQNNAANQAQQQLAQAQAELTLRTLQTKIAEMEGRLAKFHAEVGLTEAKTALTRAQVVSERVGAAYAGMQAGAAAASNPAVAPAGDEILRSSGWTDATPETGTPVAPPVAQAQQPVPQPSGPQPASPFVGEHAGIETARTTDNAPGRRVERLEDRITAQGTQLQSSLSEMSDMLAEALGKIQRLEERGNRAPEGPNVMVVPVVTASSPKKIRMQKTAGGWEAESVPDEGGQ